MFHIFDGQQYDFREIVKKQRTLTIAKDAMEVERDKAFIKCRKKLIGLKNPRQCEEKYRRVWAQKQAYKDDQNKNYWSSEDENKLQNLVQTYGFQWQMFEDYFQKRSWLQIKQKYYNDLRRKHNPEYKQEKNTISSNTENSEKTKSDNELVLAEDELFWSKYGSNYGIKVDDRDVFVQKNLIKESGVLN